MTTTANAANKDETMNAKQQYAVDTGTIEYRFATVEKAKAWRQEQIDCARALGNERTVKRMQDSVIVVVKPN